MSKLKSIPAFKTEAEERKFWETHDSTDYIDWSKSERALSKPEIHRGSDIIALIGKLRPRV